MSYTDNLVKQLISQIMKHRRYNYSQQTLYSYLQNNRNSIITPYKIKNKHQQTLQLILYSKKNQSCSTCIIYAHGLGSNKIQVLPIISHAEHMSYNFCAFDFSGSGRSEGERTTYGLRQQDDILSVLSWLDSLKKYEKYVLWGRSMGAVSIVLSQSRHLNPKVECIILDSPFSSFQKVAVQLASKKSLIPSFMLQICVEFLKKYFHEHEEYNPFTINLVEHIKKIQIKMLLMYCEADNVVNCQHSKQLKSYCKITPAFVQLKQNHNMQRTKETINQILNFIQSEIRFNNRSRRRSDSKTRGISVTSKQKSSTSFLQKQILNKTNKLELTKRKISTCRDYMFTETVNNTTNTSFSLNTEQTIPINIKQSLQNSNASKQNNQKSVMGNQRKKSISNLQNKMNWYLNKENLKPHFNYVMRKNRFK